jgi:hypothetical protein
VRYWRAVAWATSGLAGGLVLAAFIGACCPETKRIVWEVMPGTYRVDNRLTIDFTHDVLVLDNTHGDMDYQLVISPDGTKATETYQRNGTTFETVYALGPGEDVTMRSDTNLSNEHIGN